MHRRTTVLAGIVMVLGLSTTPTANADDGARVRPSPDCIEDRHDRRDVAEDRWDRREDRFDRREDRFDRHPRPVRGRG